MIIHRRPDPPAPRRTRQRPQNPKPAPLLQPRSWTAAQLNMSVQGVIRLEKSGRLSCIKPSGSEAGRAYNRVDEVMTLARGGEVQP
jgi:hypothetical protein